MRKDMADFAIKLLLAITFPNQNTDYSQENKV